MNDGKPGNDSVTQRLADFYSWGGGEQVLVALYRDEAVVYAQLTRKTAEAVFKELDQARHLVFVEPPALSKDGSTWALWLRRSKVFHGGGIDWKALLMPAVYQALTEAAPHALAAGGNLMHQDNRLLDANTVESFVAGLPSNV